MLQNTLILPSQKNRKIHNFKYIDFQIFRKLNTLTKQINLERI